MFERFCSPRKISKVLRGFFNTPQKNPTKKSPTSILILTFAEIFSE